MLDESAGWLESIADTAGFKIDHRFELIDLIDLGAKYHAAKLAQEYLDAPRLQKAYEGRLWNTSFGYWKALGAAYLHAIEQYQAGAAGAAAVRKERAVLAARALRALAVQLKWMLLRYARIEDRLWRDLGRAYLFAEGEGVEAEIKTIYPGAHGESSAQEEFAKPLMLGVSAPDGLNPLGIHIAERIIAHFGSLYVVGTAPAAACHFGYDLNLHRPPVRAVPATSAAKMMRYFGPGTAALALSRLARDIEARNAIPEAINLGRKVDPATVKAVLRHLDQYWGAQPPARSTPRNEIATRITVVPGFAAILRWVEVVSDTNSLEFSDPETAESWIVFNASDGGYGAIVPAMRADWLAIGSLIGLRPETAESCRVGIVRRLARDPYNQRRVGIQTLGTIAVPVTTCAATPNGEIRADANRARAMLLSRRPDRNGEILVLLRAGAYADNAHLELELQKRYLVAPVELKESGEDFDWARYRVVRPL